MSDPKAVFKEIDDKNSERILFDEFCNRAIFKNLEISPEDVVFPVTTHEPGPSLPLPLSESLPTRTHSSNDPDDSIPRPLQTQEAEAKQAVSEPTIEEQPATTTTSNLSAHNIESEGDVTQRKVSQESRCHGPAGDNSVTSTTSTNISSTSTTNVVTDDPLIGLGMSPD